jgi:hypothetical protein
VREHLVGQDGVCYLRRSTCKIDLKNSSLKIALLLKVEIKGGKGRKRKEKQRRKEEGEGSMVEVSNARA